ncbi:hypothetical protein AOZ06_35590 [Kibdelosporangium phytohabitans]|uniref:OmpR/PhoB-type domain-containing protein n=1 Tax=Kibdelosporangium phytohabitans TaxID=860235 RepID=A0A0N9I095_9PSEU|nr:hypothetical protein AOZ06_35590 [Kibdelosporangium phytohabitans]
MLGPIELNDEDRRIELGSNKQRAVLAVLLVNAGRPCSVDTLIDRVWDDSPPTHVRNALYSYISRIRKALRETGQPDYMLHQRNGGYVLDVPAEAVDLRRFEAALSEARSTADPTRRVALLRTALDCWHGTALQDMAGRWAEEARQGLSRKRVGACADWAKAMVDLGRHDEAIDVLEREFAEHPHAEPVAEQLMTVLHKQGRQAEALSCYAALRERLAEDLGVEPGQALRRLYLTILRDTETPAPKPEAEPEPEKDDSAGDELRRLYRKLSDAAAEWDQHARDDSLVYRGARLAAWRDRDTSGLGVIEREFLAASVDLQAHERAAGRRRAHVSLISLSFAVVAVLLLVVVVAVQNDQANSQRERATVGELVVSARNQLSRDPELSLMLAVRAVEMEPSESAQAVLAQALVESRVRKVWHDHKGAATALDINGVRVVSGGKDGTLHIWSLDGSTKPITVLAHSGPVRDVTFTTFGDRIASVAEDGTLRVWSADGNPIATIDANATAVAWQPTEGRWIAVAGKDGQVRAWPSDGRGPGRQYSRHTGRATAVDWSAGGLLASVGEDGLLIIRNLTTGAEHTRANSGVAMLDVDINPDSTAILTGGVDGRTDIWPAAGDAPPRNRRDHRDAVNTVAFSRNGEYVITGGHDRTAHIRRADDQGDTVVLRGAAGPVHGVVFTDDNSLVLTAGEDGLVRSWDPSTKPGLEVVRAHGDAAVDVAFGPDGKNVASVSIDGTFWLAKVGMRAAGMPLRSVTVSPDGRYTATAGGGGVVILWPVFEKRAPWQVRTGHAGKVQGIAFDQGGTTIATVGEDGAVRATELSTGHSRVINQAGRSPALAVAYSKDGRFLASAHEDGGIRLRRLTGSEGPVVLQGSEDMRAIAFSPHGDFIAGAGNDGAIRVWPTTGGGEPKVRTGHSGRVRDLAFSEDGQYIASVGNDQKVRLWKWAVRADAVVYEQHAPAGVTSVGFGSGKRLATGRTDGTVDLWACDVCVPVDQLLAIGHERVTRDFTPDERRLYLAWPP